ncbi:RhoGDI, GDI for Rho-like GTPase [Emiliania huxleyi CCMP1516]|uniref:Rho GDP-dissociation inhibitor n=2 Tax=Emiliania huxleyi TaxID=2903 RepID=A0A0D3J310_EMIH1|nr:RhoGDI, GDI for Rho-like GTPase [Emiliania huxleyi CCMP1516]EOD17895.1 RhoGDI, GDI for Rho-like GTPase [Emiliania huxleyi CCMP1516]|eukprot:XP_005770324.1 RhoGDI, GDI for Rho-like GTPase [Emiliania huxleyi CCMP1516]
MAEDSSDGEAHDDDTSHAAPAKKTLEELMAQKEGEDEAMQRYKMTLLKQDSFEKTDDPRHVVLMEMRILIEDRDPLVFDLVSPKKDTVFVLKEGCKYRIQLSFKVQNEIVSGLKYKHVVKRAMMKVDTHSEMLGSYAPSKLQVYQVFFPKGEWEEAPSGALARGQYHVKTTFVDDDKVEHLKFKYDFQIKSDWE